MIGAKFRSMNAASLRASFALMFPAVFLSNTASAGASNHAMSEYRSTISPLLEKHCYECHGDGYDKGKIAFDALESDEQILDPSLWLRVLNNPRAGLMPAEDKPRLSSAEQAT